jgi:hypothetical protein
MIVICGTDVVKTYLYKDVETCVLRLANIYEKMEQKGVPNIDHLDYFNKKTGVVHLFPKGLQVIPKTQQELLNEITCVLEALVVSMVVVIF